MSSRAFLGAHLSAAGGWWRAPAAAPSAGCESVQLFLRAPGRWAGKTPDGGASARFRRAVEEAGVEGRCFAHAPYLLNLASADEALRRRSIEVLVEELVNAGELGLAGVVLHPGSAGSGERLAAENRCREAIAAAIATAGDSAARLLLEGTAGAGGQLGRDPEELARLVPEPVAGRVGICLDTAHLWGAGFDLLGDGWETLRGQLEECWGRTSPDLWHANDTAVELGSRRDRHARPGEGNLGERFYRKMLTDVMTESTPVVLEIPPGPENASIGESLSLLRRWRGA